MTAVDLIQTLANACRYKGDAKVYLRMGDKTIPLHHCIDDRIDINGTRERIITLCPEGSDYYGE